MTLKMRLEGFSRTFEAEGLDSGESAELTYDGAFAAPPPPMALTLNFSFIG
ncbi:MAG: hypothetical protein OXC62_09240 [Aestuariivita sp.]|nr:hypothetical protein [Aestuariivita sp.]